MVGDRLVPAEAGGEPERGREVDARLRSLARASSIAAALAMSSGARIEEVAGFGEGGAMAARPNILMIMADQLTALALPAYGHKVVRTPHLDRLAAEGILFERAYCNFPLCAPSRASLMSGRLASRIGVYDNAAEFPAAVPTMAHGLRAMGYRTCLAGKMHFVGPDQLHGFEERLTTDIYPADFGWTPNWDAPEERIDWWDHNMGSVKEAGIAEATNQLDFDAEVAFQAERRLAEHARAQDARPLFLCVSFTHPHDPYAVPRAYWDRYRDAEIDLPASAEPAQDAHSARLRRVADMAAAEIDGADVLRARHAYYGEISLVDDQVGRLLQSLERFGLDGDTIVVVTADHGEMLGEHGLWYKMHFFEWALRVPLIFRAPERFAPRRVAAPVSLLDLARPWWNWAAVWPIRPLPEMATAWFRCCKGNRPRRDRCWPNTPPKGRWPRCSWFATGPSS